MDGPARVEPEGLREMLAAREARWERRLTLASEGRTVISVTLCMPLPFRLEAFWRAFLREKCLQLQAYLEKQKNNKRTS